MEDLKRDGRNWYPFSEARAFVRVLELKNRDEWRAETRRSGLYALGDPHPTYQPLGWGEAEAHTLAKLAHNLGMPAEVKVQEQATRSWLIRVLEQGNIVDASCHGAFVSNDFLRSRLLLAREEYLTLAEMLSREVNLRGLRLLILSACQTAVLDLLGAVDEVHSLAVGAVQAGTQAVLGALWSVDDKATYLLMVRFAQEWLPKMEHEPPAAALARAQHWLRTVTNRELQEWYATDFPRPTVEERREAGSSKPDRDMWIEEARELATNESLVAIRGNRYEANIAEALTRSLAKRRNTPDARPFADSIYWAGFQVTGW